MERKLTRNRRRKSESTIVIEYYQPAFDILGKNLSAKGYDPSTIHPIRSRYWKHVLNKIYNSESSRDLLWQYYMIVVKEIEEIISKHSITYWQHLVRRFAPVKMNNERDERTILLVRSITEACIQKFGKTRRCNRIEYSNRVREKDILQGILSSTEYAFVLEPLSHRSQLVLTDFGLEEMLEFLNLNKLSFEIWKCGAGLRTIAKGGQITILPDPEWYGINYCDDTNKLIRSYDKRIESRPFNSTATGTTFEPPNQKAEDSGYILLPIYNTALVSLNRLQHFFNQFKIGKLYNTHTNFLWVGFNIKHYYEAHLELSKPFEDLHNVTFKSVIFVITCLSIKIFLSWHKEKNPANIFHSWHRGYYGPIDKESLLNAIDETVPIAQLTLNVSLDKNDDIGAAIDFLTLDQSKQNIIDPLLRGPHYTFLPISSNYFFIDYAWIHATLYNLFYKVQLDDQNFKGEALEQSLREKESPLTNKQLISQCGKRKQIDLSFNLGNDILLIVECKAFGKSFGFERGDSRALQYRNERIEKALQQADDKAKWLSDYPVGRNYDISMFKAILPIAVTPFVEYIPSIDDFYWIDAQIPRVLAPKEFYDMINSGEFHEIAAMAKNLLHL